jgi:glycyl-tRNA synthetase
LIEDYAEKLNVKAIKELKSKDRLAKPLMNRNVTTNTRVVDKAEKEKFERLGRSLGNEDLEDVKRSLKS